MNDVVVFKLRRTINRQNLVDYIKQHYHAPRMVLSAAGGKSLHCDDWALKVMLVTDLSTSVLVVFNGMLFNIRNWLEKP